MTTLVNIDDKEKKVHEIFLNVEGEKKDVKIVYVNVKGEKKEVYKRESSRFSEEDVELGPGTYQIPNRAVGCAFQTTLESEGGNVQLVAAGLTYNFHLERYGDHGFGYRPTHSYEILFPSVNNPEEVRYLDISKDNSSRIRLKKWLISTSINEGFLFWNGFREEHVSLYGDTFDIPDRAIGLIYKANPESTMTLDFNISTKPLYYDRPRSGGSGHNHDFGITGMLFIPYESNQRASQIIIKPSGTDSYRLSIIAWLFEDI